MGFWKFICSMFKTESSRDFKDFGIETEDNTSCKNIKANDKQQSKQRVEQEMDDLEFDEMNDIWDELDGL